VHPGISVTVDILRHGETTRAGTFCGRTDAPLTELGWAQMWAAVEDAKWTAIVSSPLARCADFARTLSRKSHLPLHLDARWRELDFGEWENRTAAELMESDRTRLTAFWEDPLRHAPPGGETLAALQARVLSAWADIEAEQQPVLVVTHAGPMRVVHCHHANHPIGALLEIPIPYAALQRLQISTGKADS